MVYIKYMFVSGMFFSLSSCFKKYLSIVKEDELLYKWNILYEGKCFIQ